MFGTFCEPPPNRKQPDRPENRRIAGKHSATLVSCKVSGFNWPLKQRSDQLGSKNRVSFPGTDHTASNLFCSRYAMPHRNRPQAPIAPRCEENGQTGCVRAWGGKKKKLPLGCVNKASLTTPCGNVCISSIFDRLDRPIGPLVPPGFRARTQPGPFRHLKSSSLAVMSDTVTCSKPRIELMTRSSATKQHQRRMRCSKLHFRHASDITWPKEATSNLGCSRSPRPNPQSLVGHHLRKLLVLTKTGGGRGKYLFIPTFPTYRAK